MPEAKKPGRPPTGSAMTGAERQRQYIERIKARAPTPDTGETAELRRKLADALEEVARLNKEGDALAVKVDRLTRALKASDNANTKLGKRVDELAADLDYLRSRVARWKGQDGTETTTEPTRAKAKRKTA